MESEKRGESMIPFDFEYYRPDTIQEAVEVFQALLQQGKAPRYYSGGTEILSMARLSQLHTGAVVDIKRIPECSVVELRPECLVLGSAATLSSIEEANFFPLLTTTGGRVADHTIRQKITLGGNICGRFIYREAVLPLLLTDAQLLLAGPEGTRSMSIHEVFNQTLQLSPGEFLVQASIGLNYLIAPNFHAKCSQHGKIGYPLVTLAALKYDGQLRTAFSGLCDYPFRLFNVEEQLNKRELSPSVRVETAMDLMPPIFSSVEVSSAYRAHVLRHTLLEAVAALEDVV
jgi:CO/xanthine dehydrogenase FAD-binding subunit